MQKIGLVVCFLFLVLLTACTVRGPSVRVTAPSVEFDNDGYGHPAGYHCPPGQAKKGRC